MTWTLVEPPTGTIPSMVKTLAEEKEYELVMFPVMGFKKLHVTQLTPPSTEHRGVMVPIKVPAAI